ncbi:MAG: hypothetical protein ABI945_05290, partial [Nitrospirales bacterium]
MLWSRAILVTLLVLLFQAYSFNAYACLLPMSPTAESADMRDCPSSQEQAPRQICDVFKTMGVPTFPEPNPAVDSQAFCPEDALSVVPTVSCPALIRSLADHPAVPPQEVLV